MTDDELDKFDGEDEDIYDDIEGDDDIKPSPHKSELTIYILSNFSFEICSEYRALVKYSHTQLSI